MLYLGEYDELDAKEIKRDLERAGIKSELKPCLKVNSDSRYYLKERMSALKELIEAPDHEKLMRYLEAMKGVTAQATEDDFEDLYLRALYPEMMARLDEITAQLEKEEGSDEDVGAEEAIGEDKEEKEGSVENEVKEEGSGEGEDTGAVVERDENEIDHQLTLDNEVREYSKKTRDAMSFAWMIFNNNDVNIGEAVEEKLDDPVLVLYVDPEKLNTKSEQLMCKVRFELEKTAMIFVDEFTTPLVDELDEEFWDLNPTEAEDIKSMGLLIEALTKSPRNRRMDLSEFEDGCVLELEQDMATVVIDGSDVAEELAKVLEKNGVIKIKGDRIKWKE